MEGTSLCSLHVKTSGDRTRAYQLGRARIQLPGSAPTQCGERQETGPERRSTLRPSYLLYPQAVRAPEDERVSQAAALDVFNCEVWCGEKRRGKALGESPLEDYTHTKVTMVLWRSLVQPCSKQTDFRLSSGCPGLCAVQTREPRRISAVRLASERKPCSSLFLHPSRDPGTPLHKSCEQHGACC